jgi:hypothetical protein
LHLRFKRSAPNWGSPLNAHSGASNFDIFVLKLDNSGSYQWHTFYGGTRVTGNDDDEGLGIALDGNGNLYVTGHSEATWGTPINTHSGLQDIFVLKLNGSGAYQWHTFYGSANSDYGGAIAVDGSDNVYVTGYSMATWGSPLHPYSGEGGADIVVLKMRNLFRLSGAATANGAPLPGATMNLSGAAIANTATGADGTYGFSGLSNGVYTITPAKAPYLFTPQNRSLNINEADVVKQDFTGVLPVVKPTVTVKAADAKASEPGTDKGKFVITRTGDTSKLLTVYYKMAGTATNGTDYKKLAGKIVIPIGKASATLILKPTDDKNKERKETAKLTLMKNASYTVGTPASATVAIADND